ncbi:hypothetical protein [[Eubacterium] cellulosolvens]
MKVRRIQALTFSPEPTKSGTINNIHQPVAGELVPVDKLSVFLSISWFLIILILILPITFILYRKRNVTMKLLNPLVSRLFEYALP